MNIFDAVLYPAKPAERALKKFVKHPIQVHDTKDNREFHTKFGFTLTLHPDDRAHIRLADAHDLLVDALAYGRVHRLLLAI